MTDVTMPRLSDSMEDGTILRWLKQAGENVSEGDDLVEIETDKATMTYESPGAGVLVHPVPEGGSYPVGAVIATLGPAGVLAAKPSEPEIATVPVRTASPVPERSAVRPAVGAHVIPGVPTSATPVSTPNGSKPAATVSATPLARRMANAHGINLTTLTGTGPRGRITRTDVATAAGASEPTSASTAASHLPPPDARGPATPTLRSRGTSPQAPNGSTASRELTHAQQLIAQRMAESKTTVPHFQVQTEVLLDRLLVLRGELKLHTGRPPSINDFIVKASGIALGEFPLANASFREDRFEIHERVNVGVAVTNDDALVVPTVTDADSRSLGAIARETRRLSGAVRDGTITPRELSGATFTVSNLGMYGMTAITPVVNMPQAAILGVGAARLVLARVDGEITEQQVMSLTLSCDHRILYGAGAARFLSRIRETARASAPAGAMTIEKHAIPASFDRFEVMPFASVDREVDAIDRPLTLTVTCSPKYGVDHTIEVAARLRSRGHRVLPHVAARMVTDEDHLSRILEAMSAADMHNLFLVGGDHPQPMGRWGGSLPLLESIREHELAPRTIGVPAYPEGHPAIAPEVLIADLRAKARLADFMTTQMCFDAGAVIGWLRGARADGITLPAYIGVPGIVDRRRLLEISLRVGVGESVAFLRKQSRATRLLGPRRAATRRLHDELAVLASATHRDGWDAGVAGLHVYTFNKLVESVALLEGQDRRRDKDSKRKVARR